MGRRLTTVAGLPVLVGLSLVGSRHHNARPHVRPRRYLAVEEDRVCEDLRPVSNHHVPHTYERLAAFRCDERVRVDVRPAAPDRGVVADRDSSAH